MEILENGLQTHSGVSLQNRRSVDADAWCKRALTVQNSHKISFCTTLYMLHSGWPRVWDNMDGVFAQRTGNLPTQLSQRLQWEARGGLKILHVKQYLSLMTWPLITTSFVRGGGRYVFGDPEAGISAMERDPIVTTTKSTKNIPWKKMVPLNLVARSWLLLHLFCYPKSVNYHNQLLSILGRDFSNLCGADKTRVIACGILVD